MIKKLIALLFCAPFITSLALMSSEIVTPAGHQPAYVQKTHGNYRTNRQGSAFPNTDANYQHDGLPNSEAYAHHQPGMFRDNEAYAQSSNLRNDQGVVYHQHNGSRNQRFNELQHNNNNEYHHNQAYQGEGYHGNMTKK